MPARTNPFQKLVLHVEQHLANGATVDESLMLQSRVTLTKREVDVVIGHPPSDGGRVVCIEVVDHVRRADINWVEQMKAKHEQLPTNHLILVSRSGFTEPCFRYAQANAIELYAPEDGVMPTWSQLEDRATLYFGSYVTSPTRVELVVATPRGNTLSRASAEETFLGSDGQPTLSARDVVMSALRTKQAFELIANALGAGVELPTCVTLEGTVDPESTPALYTTLIDQNDGAPADPILCRIVKIRMTCSVSRRVAPIPLKSHSWRGLGVAFGDGTTDLGKVTITMVQRADGTVDLRAIINGVDVPVQKA